MKVIVGNKTRMVHLAFCRKNMIATDIAKPMWKMVVKSHGIPRIICSCGGAQLSRSIQIQSDLIDPATPGTICCELVLTDAKYNLVLW